MYDYVCMYYCNNPCRYESTLLLRSTSLGMDLSRLVEELWDCEIIDFQEIKYMFQVQRPAKTFNL